jgi:hypothetical protein
MTGLLLYGYCQGVLSSRKIEKAALHPVHDTIAEFRFDALYSLLQDLASSRR